MSRLDTASVASQSSSLGSESSPVPVPVPTDVPPVLPNSVSSKEPSLLIRPWNDGGYDWTNIGLNTQSPKQVVNKFSFLDNKKNITNLDKNIENNAILTLSGVVGKSPELDYFNYDSLGMKGQNISKDVKDEKLRNALGFGGFGNSAKEDVRVVTLLTGSAGIGRTTFIGICYDSCAKSSKISRAFGFSDSETNRLICEKLGLKSNVKIAFFPRIASPDVQNSSDFIFYEGGVMFGDNGVFLGFEDDKGTLLKKLLHGAGDEYSLNLFHAKFSKNAIVPHPSNKMYQYTFNGDLTGYASGKIGWDLKPSNATPPLESLSSDENFCLNLNLGSFTVPKDTNDDKASICSKMYYTVSHRDVAIFGEQKTNALFNAAGAGRVVIAPPKRKIEFIVKENYTEYVPSGEVDKCTLYKFKCQVGADDGIFCIIEVIICRDNIKRIRIYKFYTMGKPVDGNGGDTQNGIKKGVIKKEGLFVAMRPGTEKIKSVSVVQQCTTGLYGMEYTTMSDDAEPLIKSRKLMPIDASEAMVKEYEKVKTKPDGSEVFNVSKLSSRCRLFDDSTKISFDSSISAAAACYSLFFGGGSGGGCVAILLNQLSSQPSEFVSDIDISVIASRLISQVNNVSERLSKNLMVVVDVVDNAEKSKLVGVKSRFIFQDITVSMNPQPRVDQQEEEQQEEEQQEEEQQEEEQQEEEQQEEQEQEQQEQEEEQQQQQAVTLPEGWTQHIDPASGRSFYATATGKSQWELPENAAIEEANSPNAVAPIQPQQQQQQQIGNYVKQVQPDGKTKWVYLKGGRGTNKNRHQQRRGNGNMRRRITHKVKRSRRVVHRGGGGRGGKIYRKTKKHGRGGRGRGGRGGRGRGCSGGHRRTIKKYHRR
jgi:hypothetical protein